MGEKSEFTEAVEQVKEEIGSFRRTTKPGIPFGMERVTPKQVRRRWEAADEEGKRRMITEMGPGSLLKALKPAPVPFGRVEDA
jgi:hypothetical protein